MARRQHGAPERRHRRHHNDAAHLAVERLKAAAKSEHRVRPARDIYRVSLTTLREAGSPGRTGGVPGNDAARESPGTRHRSTASHLKRHAATRRLVTPEPRDSRRRRVRGRQPNVAIESHSNTASRERRTMSERSTCRTATIRRAVPATARCPPTIRSAGLPGFLRRSGLAAGRIERLWSCRQVRGRRGLRPR